MAPGPFARFRELSAYDPATWACVPGFNALTRFAGTVKQRLHSLTEKDRARSRAMDLDMTIRAVRVLRVLIMLRTRGLFSAHTMGNTVTRQTELAHAAGDQQTRIG